VHDGVTAAGPRDEDEIFEMLLGLHEENGLFSVDEERTRAFIRTAITPGGGIVGVIRGADGKLEASVGMTLDQWWYTSDWCLSERWVYVVPAARKRSFADKHASRLIDYAKWAAEQLGVPLQMGILSTTRTAAKEKMYGRKLTPVGALFMWSPDGEVRTGRPAATEKEPPAKKPPEKEPADVRQVEQNHV